MRLSLTVCLFSVFLHLSSSEVNHCSLSLLPSLSQGNSQSSSELIFTKELAERDFSLDSHFKSLHCCAKGYLSIEWFKDGRPYPWPGDVSSFILYPESANQTVYTTALRASDAGNYTCKIHNYTAELVHNTELRVFDAGNGYADAPLATYSPPPVALAAPGSIARLFCEAFVGHIDLPDAVTEVKWEKKGNATFEAPHIEVTDVKRESEIVGKYLLINNVDQSDFGTYYCSISNTGDQKIVMETVLKPLSSEDSGFCLSEQITLGLLFLSAPVAGVLLYFTLRSLAAYKIWDKLNEFRSTEGRSARKSGLVILYSELDQAFVEASLAEAARQDTYLFLQKLKPEDPIPEETLNLCSKIGKTVIFLSKQLVPVWTKAGIEEWLEKIIMADKLYSIVLLEALPEALAVPKKRLNVFDKSDPLLWSKLKEANTGQQQQLAASCRPLARLSSRLTGGQSKIVEVHV